MKDALSPAGLVLKNEEVKWMDWRRAGRDVILSDFKFNVTLKATPAEKYGFSRTIVLRFPASFINDQIAGVGGTSHNYGWLADPNGAQKTNRIDLTRACGQR
jgi:hypothetical protein